MARPTRSPTASSKVAVAVPNYEVKLFLDPVKVLDVEFKPTREADSTLGLKNSNRKIAMQFLDLRPPQLAAEGWTVRARKFEGSDDLDLSYKRRYPISSAKLADALAAAAAHGFHADEDDYAAQVEWGFAKQTLSFTRKKEIKNQGGRELDLPSADELKQLAIREMPGKLDDWKTAGWARGLLTQAHLYGPVLGKRWEGDWPGPELSFEVWLIRTQMGPGLEPVVELSFKEKSLADANGFREKLTLFIRDQGWLLERDVLKTSMILDRY